MAWDLLSEENVQNRHIDHNLKIVYVYMEVLRETTNEDGETVMIEKTDWYPPEEYTSPYYNGPLTRYEPRVKTQTYDMGLYPDVVNVSFDTVKIGSVNEEYKLMLVNKRILELLREGKSYVKSRNIMLSEWEGPGVPEWTAEEM